MGFTDLPRTGLGFFPTPVQELKRLSYLLGGPQIFIKRDDQSGVACGGNKVRKLEYLVADALSMEADTLVTGGAAQSNHCRQTAAAASIAGLECHLALGGEAVEHYQGNVLLDRLLGATIHWCGENRKGEQIPDICNDLRRMGRIPYVVPYGGSNPVGAAGFVEAICELNRQQQDSVPQFSHVLFASSSGGTHAGMLVGGKLCSIETSFVGVAIDKDEMDGVSLEEHIIDLAYQTAELIDLNTSFTTQDLVLSRDYLGGGYGVVGKPEKEAISLLAELEGILLDPVYTGRALAGLIGMIRKGDLNSQDRVLFWHTGGLPALFAYGNDIFDD